MSAASDRSQKAQHRTPFANWPTIKVISIPMGIRSLERDEWCATYCTQNISGRTRGAPPNCRSICIRKVFPHEVRNIMSFKRHRDVSAEDGKAKYPLPAEGQPSNIPRLLGGSRRRASDDRSKDDSDSKHWDQGWYFWTTGHWAEASSKIVDMRMDLPNALRYKKIEEQVRVEWDEYQQFLERQPLSADELVTESYPPGKWTKARPPPPPFPRDPSQSLLIPLPPQIPIAELIGNLLKPTYRALEILRENIEEGNFRRFGYRIWEKAQTKEPFILASNSMKRVYEIIMKDTPPDDESKKTPP